MAINPDRPIITYENVALFQSQTPAHNAASNSGSNLSFLPLVQGIDFSVDIPRTNVGALGAKSFIDQSNRNAPDVNFTINIFEDFGNLFSGLVSGANTRDDLNIDRNFYAYIAPERGVDARKDRSANVRYYCVRSLSSANTDVAVPYSGTTLYEEDFDGSNRTVLNTYTEPTGVQMAVTSGKVYYGDKPTHWHGEGNNNSLIPFYLAGKQFGFYTYRYEPNRISVLSLEDNADVDVYVNVTNGINGTATYSTSLNAGETYVFEDSTTTATIIIDSTKNILCSKEGNGGDKLLLAPVETDVYRSVNLYQFNITGGAPQTTGKHYVYDPSGAFATDIGDGAGSDAVGHISYNKLTKYQTFASSKSDSNNVGAPNWTVVAPYPDTDVNISYYSGSSWNLWSGFNLDGTKTNPAANYNFDPLIGVRLWKMESTKPVAFFINDQDADEEILIGWNDEHLPENQTSFGQFLSFGNCFLNNISISQSVNGLMQSQYSFTASNVQAEEVNAHDVGFNSLLYTGVSVPSIDLTGAQTQNLTTNISGVDEYYSNSSDRVVPHYSTNITISGSNSVGNFLIKSDSIQNFELELPINRKTIYSLGKKYPVARKALFPIESTFNFSNRVSSFEVDGERANLKDFLNTDETYTLNINGTHNVGGSFNLEIENAKLISQSYNSVIGSDIVADLGFTFDLQNITFTTLELDSDGDGLSDFAEINTHLTDPNDTDSDDDGLSDGAEVNTYSTDPLDQQDPVGFYAGYSLKNIYPNYTSEVVDVRRTSDQGVTGFTATEVSDGTLVSWVGAGQTGYTTKWYDQSSNVNHVLQTDTGKQPIIVDGGNLVTGSDGEAAVDGAGNKFLTGSTTASWINNTEYSAFCVGETQKTTNYAFFVGTYQVGTDKGLNIGFRDSNSVTVAHYSDDQDFSFSNDFGRHLHSAVFHNSTSARNSSYFIDGSELTREGILLGELDDPDNPLNTDNQLGVFVGTTSFFWDGKMQELLLFNSDETGNRGAIEQTIANRQGITLN